MKLLFCCVYRTNQEVCNCVTKLEQFSVPTFMIEKMKNFIRSVQGELEGRSSYLIVQYCTASVSGT